MESLSFVLNGILVFSWWLDHLDIQNSNVQK